MGFTGAQPLLDLTQYLKGTEKEGCFTPFVEADITLRTDPQAVWAACKTVVVLAYPLPLTSKSQPNEGVLARSSVGEDYHHVLHSRLDKLLQKLREINWPSEQIQLQVDTGPLNERGFALRSGLGWAGRNQQLIVPGVGSFVALALVFLDQELPPDEPMDNLCGTCQKCIQSCPAQVLGKEHFVATQCLSFLTQSKERLSDGQAKSLGQRLFGCDTCQEACPHNQGFLRREEEAQNKVQRQSYNRTEGVSYSDEATCLRRGADLYEVLNLTKAQFNERFRWTAAGWRGKGILQRNAYRIMENLQDERRIAWLNENKDNQTLPLVLRQELMGKNKDR